MLTCCSRLLLASCLALMVLTGCATTKSTVPVMGMGDLSFEPLKRGEYTVLKTVEGEGTVYRVLLFFSCGDSQFGYVSRISMPGIIMGSGSTLPDFAAVTPQSLASAAATYDAMSKVPEADVVLPVSTQTDSNWFPGFAWLWKAEHARVKCKAIVLKDDSTMPKQ